MPSSDVFMPQAARAGLASRGVNGYGEKPLDTWRSVSNDDVGSAKREPVPAQSSAGRGWKIDRTCVKEMGAGHEDSVIVSAIPMLARALGSGGMEKAWKRPSN